MIKKVFIIIAGLFLVCLIVFLTSYFFSKNVYINVKYGEDIGVEEYNIKNDLSSLMFSDKINNYIRTKEFFSFIEIYDSGVYDSEIYKPGNAYIKIYVDENDKAIFEFISIADYQNNSYLEELESKKIEINIENNKAKYVACDKQRLYILTENNKLYYYFLSKDNDDSTFEHEISYIKEGKYSIVSENVTEIINYYNNDENLDSGRIYGLLDSNEIINVVNGKNFYEIECNASIFRYGNANLAVNREGTIQYCNQFEDGAYSCDGYVSSKVITDTNEKPIVISMLIEHDSYLYIIDIEGNIYTHKFDNQNHIAIEKIEKYNNNKVRSLTYVYKHSEPYMLEELIINYSNGTRKSLKEISRLDIYHVD